MPRSVTKHKANGVKTRMEHQKLWIRWRCISYPTEPSSNRINSNFLSTTYIDKFKADINTGISSIQEKAKKEFGVDVPKRMAYRARTKAQQLVLGDHKK
jgi:hypothetical protein